MQIFCGETVKSFLFAVLKCISILKKEVHVEIDSMQDIDYYKSEIKQLNAKIYTLETEANVCASKLKQLEEENISLKTQLLSLNAYGTTCDGESQQMIENTNLKINSLKEIDKYKGIISDLIKSNEEKERKCDELTKQVIRFKRIQEIVLSAQTNMSNQMKNKSKHEIS